MPQSEIRFNLPRLCKTVARSSDVPQSEIRFNLPQLCKTVARSFNMPPRPKCPPRVMNPQPKSYINLWQSWENLRDGDQHTNEFLKKSALAKTAEARAGLGGFSFFLR